MKHPSSLFSLLLTLSSLIPHPLSLSAAVPLTWTVDMRRAQPATFEAYQGETLGLEASLTLDGKPFEAPSNYSFFWQTNGMGSTYWDAPCPGGTGVSPVQSNVLFATWLPSYDVGARVYNCFIGSPSNNYHTAFQLRLRPSPGATPNALPLPTPVIDFARVRVLNPPWGAGVDTNAVIDIIHKTVDGAARPLPKYLWLYEADDSYPDEAAWYYAQPQDYGQCSAMRDGGFLYRNYDWKFDDAAEFVVKVSQGPSRFASVGVANCGTNLTESFVTSGKPSRYYKCLPGRVVDGINENGVVCEVNVVDGSPQTNGWHTTGDIHPLAAVRWSLDNGTSAGMVASNLASRIAFPQGWAQNFHWMVADESSTYIVENGTAYPVSGTGVSPVHALTNFRLYPTPSDGEGQERYVALTNGANITSQWWTLTYTQSGYRPSDLPGITGQSLTNLFNYWASKPREAHRGETFGGQPWWQSVHTSIYDLTNRTLRVAVQETDDWYVFQVPSAGGVKPDAVREIVEPMITGKLDKTDVIAPSYEESSKGKAADAFETEGEIIIVREDAESALNESRGATEISYQALVLAEQLDDIKLNAPAASSVTDGNLAVLSKSGNSVTLADGGVRPADVANAIAYSRATYDYMNGNTNAWFSGTNYVVGAENTNRTHFAFEDGMDLATVPCSMSLWEIRDGKRKCVWDQRDWPTWYWNFKLEQYKAEREAKDQEIVSRMAGYSPTNWSSHTACGLTNAATDTTWFDTPKIVLSAGYAWQHQLTVDGVGYWGIEGNGCKIGGSGTNATLRITDWEGNEVFKITKGSARLAYLTGGSGVASGLDGEYMWYDMRTGDSNSAPQPMGEFTIDLREPFYEEGANCPAEVREYEDRGNGVWRCYFRAKPGINANACFARFKVQTGTETTVEYANAPTINGGLIFNGRKIAPVIPANAAVGDVITWKVLQ